MTPLEYDKYYHVFNRGNNRDDLFHSDDDYKNFLRLYEKYINPVADTFAWVLLKNHFHLLIRIKTIQAIGVCLPLKANKSNDDVKFQTTTTNRTKSEENKLTESAGPVRVFLNENIESETTFSPSINSDRSIDSVRLKLPDPTRHFSHLFNAYARNYNLKYKRTGTLFERPFKRIEVTSDRYLRQLVVYIHNNPVHHDFTNDFTDYPWSSYQSLISADQTKPQHQEVIGWFDDIENLRAVHYMKVDAEQVNEILLE